MPYPELLLIDQIAPDGSEDWQDRSLCAQTDPEAFFPPAGGSTKEAKKVCQNCEVRPECLEAALANDERFGLWGGVSERDRRKIKKAGTSARQYLARKAAAESVTASAS